MTLLELERLFLTVLEITVSTAVVIAVMLLLTSLFTKKYTAGWRRVVWTVVALRLLLPFSFTLPTAPIILPKVESSVSWQEMKSDGWQDDRAVAEWNLPLSRVIVSHGGGANEIAYQDPGGKIYYPGKYEALRDAGSDLLVTVYTDGTMTPSGSMPAELTPEPVQRSISIMQLAALVWLGGALFILTFHLGSYAAFRNSVRRWRRPVQDERILSALYEAKHRAATTEYFRIYTCRKVKTPMITGIRTPVILLPEQEYGPELSMILSHELLHHKRHDIGCKALALLAACIHWFNPLVWWMTRELDRVIEIACDEALMNNESFDRRKRYGEVLLDSITTQRLPALATSFGGGKRAMLQRLRTILDTSVKRRGPVALAGIVLVSFVASSLVSCGRPPVSQQNKSLTIHVSNSIMRDAIEVPLRRFREAHPGVMVRLTGYHENIPSRKNYSSQKSYEKAVENYRYLAESANRELPEKLTTSEHSPDLLLFGDELFDDVNKAMAADAFANLNQYMERDPAYHESQYRQTMMAAGQFRGKQFTMPLFGTFNLLVTTQEILSELHYNPKEAQNFTNQFAALSLAGGYGDIRTNRQVYYDQRFPTRWPEYAGMKLLDYDRGKVLFDTPEFYELQTNYTRLHLFGEAGRLASAPPIDEAEALCRGTARFVSASGAGTALYTAAQVARQKQPVLLPVRSSDGGIQGKVVASAAISDRSANQKLAYEFLKLLMDSEFQSTTEYRECLTLRRTDESKRLAEFVNDSYRLTNLLAYLDEESGESYVKWISEITSFAYPSSVYQRIYDCFLPYYQAETSYEDCMKAAKAHLQNYLYA